MFYVAKRYFYSMKEIIFKLGALIVLVVSVLFLVGELALVLLVIAAELLFKNPTKTNRMGKRHFPKYHFPRLVGHKQ